MAGELTELREAVDAVDRRLVALLARRQGLVEKVARLKRDPTRVRDPERIEAVMANVLAAASLAGLAHGIAEPVWRLLLERCADHEAEWLRARAEGPRDSCCGCEDGPRGRGRDVSRAV